jgi:SWI/SNF-related matrix-associated actin-dependent regulator 1 of chromatin subfamily A
MAVRLERIGQTWVAKTDGPQDRFGPKAAGFRWNPEKKHWWTDRDDAALALRDCASPIAREELDQIAAKREASLQASRATDAEIDLPAPAGLDYLPFQRAGIAFALDHPNVLFADEMGLGKTIEAIGLVNALPEIESVLVICPASLRINWQREWERWATRPMRVAIATTKDAELPKADVVIVNYDILKKLRAPLRSRTWDLLICDEAHYMKSNKAQRTREVLGRNVRAKAGAGWIKDPAPIPAKRLAFLTGTPILNKPIESWTLLHALAPEVFKNWKWFTRRYCDASFNGYGTDVSGASNLEELQDKARASCMVRRKKSEVLTELPPKRRQVIELPPNGCANVVKAEAKAWAAHEEALRELRARVELAKASEDPEDYAQAVANLRESVSAAFTEIAKLRHETALAKVPFVVEHLRDALEAGGKVVCFAHHRDVIAELAEQLADFAPAIITGATPMEARQEQVDHFQANPEARVFLGNLQAAGVGLTLTAASHVVFAELDWVPGNITQAEDRCHRIGQRSSVLVQHLVLQGSLDARMAQVIVEKQDVIDRALDRRTDGTGAVPAALEVPAIPSGERAATRNASAEQLAKEAEALSASQLEAIHEALRQVAGMCDGAIQRDGAGFNKLDTQIGTELACQATLTPKQAALGRKIVKKYRRQFPTELLEAMGAKQ